MDVSLAFCRKNIYKALSTNSKQTEIRMNAIIRNIPNAVTCMNVLSGTIAIIVASKGVEPFWCSLPAWQWACIFIGIAAVADFCDGLCARLLHAYSEMGKELDSLCDLVSFGVAPAVLFYQCVASTQAPEHQWIGWLALLIPVGGALRLAKFNIDTRQTTSFIGLPIPANAIYWIGFVAFTYEHEGAVSLWWFILSAILLAYAMVSEIPLFSLKFKNLRLKENLKRYVLILCAAVSVISMGLTGLMWTIMVYVLLSLIPSSQSSKS